MAQILSEMEGFCIYKQSCLCLLLRICWDKGESYFCNIYIDN